MPMKLRPDMRSMRWQRRYGLSWKNPCVWYGKRLLLLLLAMLSSFNALAEDSSRERISLPTPPPTRQSSPVEQPRQDHVVTGLAVTNSLDVAPQLPGIRVTRVMSFRAFMHELEGSNLDLAAQGYNVPIAAAQADAAG